MSEEENTHLLSVVHFIRKMNDQALFSALDEGQYQKMEKSWFIFRLHQVFNKFKEAGEFELTTHPGVCNECSKGCKGFSFVGKYSRKYIDLLFKENNYRVSNIYECCDFQNDEKIDKAEKLYIQDFSGFFRKTTEEDRIAFDKEIDEMLKKMEDEEQADETGEHSHPEKE